MGNSYSSKIKNRKKASKASLQVSTKLDSDFIPFLPNEEKEEYEYCRKSRITRSGRVYEIQKYDYYENLTKTLTQGLQNSQIKEIVFEDFVTSSNNPLEMQNYGIVKMTLGIDEWRQMTRNVKNPHIDNNFKPRLESVLGNADKSDSNSKLKLCLKYPPLIWDRPFMYSLRKMKSVKNWEDFRKSKVKNEKIIFFKNEEFNFIDIYQGVLPNSHFFSPLIAFSRKKENLTGSIFHEKNDVRGIFGFLFNIKGKWKIESVDDNLCYFERTLELEDLKPENPKKKKSSKKKMRLDFLSGRAETKLIWPLLMEKAYAKILGGYYNLARSSDAGLVFSDLTGCPSETKEVQDYSHPSQIWDEISEGLKKGFLYCAMSVDSDEAKENFVEEFTNFQRGIRKGEFQNFPYQVKKEDFMVEQLGVFPNQVYPILSAKSGRNGKYYATMDPRGRLKMREVKKHEGKRISGYCNHEKRFLQGKNRLFKIHQNDFPLLFKQVIVCYFQSNVMTTTLSSNFQPNMFCCFSLKFDSVGTYSIRVSQGSHLKKSRGRGQKIKYPAIQILLVRVTNDNEYEYVEGKIESFRDVFMVVDTIDHQQNYNLFVRINSRKSKNLGICITGFGNVIAEKLMHFGSEIPSASDFGFQIAQALTSKLWEEEKEEFHPVSLIGEQNQLLYLLLTDSTDGFGVALFRNRSFRKKFKIKLPFFNYVYPMKLRDSNQSELSIVIDCGEDEAIVWDCSETLDLKFGIEVIELNPEHY